MRRDTRRGTQRECVRQASSPKTLAAESTLAKEANDQSEPIENADPTEPIEKAEPIEPIDANEPMLPIDAAEPIDRCERHDLMIRHYDEGYRGRVDELRVEELLADAVARLGAAGARDEQLVDFVQPRWLGVKLPAKLVPVERVWRLGVLLLGRSGKLYATGTTLRVSEPRHPNAQSRLAEDRRELRAIALKSGISGGDTINLDAVDIPIDDLTADTRPVARTADGLVVQWSPASDALAPLETYLAERVVLLVDPPAGA